MTSEVRLLINADDYGLTRVRDRRSQSYLPTVV